MSSAARPTKTGEVSAVPAATTSNAPAPKAFKIPPKSSVPGRSKSNSCAIMRKQLDLMLGDLDGAEYSSETYEEVERKRQELWVLFCANRSDVPAGLASVIAKQNSLLIVKRETFSESLYADDDAENQNNEQEEENGEQENEHDDQENDNHEQADVGGEQLTGPPNPSAPSRPEENKALPRYICPRDPLYVPPGHTPISSEEWKVRLENAKKSNNRSLCLLADIAEEFEKVVPRRKSGELAKKLRWLHRQTLSKRPDMKYKDALLTRGAFRCGGFLDGLWDLENELYNRNPLKYLHWRALDPNESQITDMDKENWEDLFLENTEANFRYLERKRRGSVAANAAGSASSSTPALKDSQPTISMAEKRKKNDEVVDEDSDDDYEDIMPAHKKKKHAYRSSSSAFKQEDVPTEQVNSSRSASKFGAQQVNHSQSASGMSTSTASPVLDDVEKQGQILQGVRKQQKEMATVLADTKAVVQSMEDSYDEAISQEEGIMEQLQELSETLQALNKAKAAARERVVVEKEKSRTHLRALQQALTGGRDSLSGRLSRLQADLAALSQPNSRACNNAGVELDQVKNMKVELNSTLRAAQQFEQRMEGDTQSNAE